MAKNNENPIIVHIVRKGYITVWQFHSDFTSIIGATVTKD